MLRILRNITSSQKLLTSHLYSEKVFYQAFLRDLRKARRRVVIESPYMTERRAKYFSSLFKQLHRKGVKVQIHTRHPRLHDSLMRSNADKALRILAGCHAQIHTHYDRRHWKLAAVDNVILWEGSLNILSHANSREIMRRTDSPYLCRRMLKLVRKLK